MPTTAELTEKYINEHPSIKDCLKKRIINYSKLSRRIAKELGIEKQSSMEAILVACRRYAIKMKHDSMEDKVLMLLKGSQLDIKNRIMVVIVDKKVYAENLSDIEKKIRKTADIFYAIEGTSVFTIITSELYLDDIKKIFERDIVKITKNLAAITIKSPKDMEKTFGVTAYIFSLFAERGINIVETMSCWTDTIVVVSEDDVAKIMKNLHF